MNSLYFNLIFRLYNHYQSKQSSHLRDKRLLNVYSGCTHTGQSALCLSMFDSQSPVLKHGTLCRRWQDWKRWTSVRYGCTCTNTGTRFSDIDTTACGGFASNLGRQQHTKSGWRAKKKSVTVSLITDTRGQLNNVWTRWKKWRNNVFTLF